MPRRRICRKVFAGKVIGVLSAETATPIEQVSEVNLLNLLVVDGEHSVRTACLDVAQSLGFHAQQADNLGDAYHILDNTGVDVVLLDLHVPGGNGRDELVAIKRQRPEAAVIVMTGFASVHSAVQAVKSGAYGYIAKPLDYGELRMSLERVAAHVKLTIENRLLREQVRARQCFRALVGHSLAMEKLYRIIAKAAHSTHPVLIVGESGTGKELVARSIHDTGDHGDKPFVAVDCGSLVPALIESELFGYVKGAFSGARAKGLLAAADGGTVFLDEIGELPIELQAKLLRAIQEKEIRPVGGSRPIPINVRILAASNRDLEAAVQHGAFRRDLYFRLNVLTLRVPPLRERKEDIPLLVGHILERINGAHESHKSIGDDALRLLLHYDWPGNVRELENCLERICATCSLPTIHIADLPMPLRGFEKTRVAPPFVANGEGIKPLAELEKQAILHAIEALKGDKLKAASQLGIGKTTLYRKLKEYGAAR